MAATTTATINIGRYTRQVTKARSDQAAVIAQAKEAATGKGLTVLVKRDHAGRWQGFALRDTARGREHGADYQVDAGQDRHAKKRDAVGLARVYVADTNQASGEIEAVVLNSTA